MRGYIPENKNKQKIMDSVCSEIYLEDGKQSVPDESLHTRFDNLYWKQGYCTEAVKACVRFASDKLKIKELYTTIRPENRDSIRIAEKTGMVEVGEQIKIYRKKKRYRIGFTGYSCNLPTL